ncbi:hypothetical protein APA386B_2015 [Acetobacter pasteurianus 386B]|nr:hypothetical protein APA386B_2015 [Acetobacter pasteurianus 386B]
MIADHPFRATAYSTAIRLHFNAAHLPARSGGRQVFSALTIGFWRRRGVHAVRVHMGLCLL